MKLIHVFLLAVIMLYAPLLLLADNGNPPNPISLDIFTSFAALVAGVVSLTALIKTFIGTEGLITEIVSWVIGPIIGIIGFFLQIGIFIELSWYMALLYGLMASFSANKGWDIYKLFVKSK